jgi:hypothetical protein
MDVARTTVQMAQSRPQTNSNDQHGRGQKRSSEWDLNLPSSGLRRQDEDVIRLQIIETTRQDRRAYSARPF